MVDEGTATDRVLTTQEALNRIKAIVANIEAGQGGNSGDIADIKAAVEAIKADSDLSTPDIADIKAAVESIEGGSGCTADYLGYVRIEGSQLDPGDELYIIFPSSDPGVVLNGKITDIRVKVLLAEVLDNTFYKLRSELQFIDHDNIPRALDQGLILCNVDYTGGFNPSYSISGYPGVEFKAFEAPLYDVPGYIKRPHVWIKNIGGDRAYITTIAQFNKKCVEVVQ